MIDRAEEASYLFIADRRILESEDKIQELLERLDSVRIQDADQDVALALLAAADEVLITLKTFRAQVLENLQSSNERP